ncbi:MULTISPECIES: TRAP transporter large permease [Stappiaceae]|uniref:TRAP transporter large permease n=1 Tax=Stappiaceae TaxID=2821832 RepID=UPI0003B90857|nr:MULTISPECIES: TRAP transporter large permease [Stappiaceae]ERP95350.1 ABC transporter permease [Labrenzia sp. C1B10]ERS03194.1 ABC transporter permease [Labrenzia sp. C1B70]MBN8180454.1 TRAP transporter large permease [Roseibium aggregatum]UES45422.1 TRAP transporter large permease subunit [Roseibium aggregatum]
MLIWFLPVFLVFLLIGLPVFFGLLAAPGLLLWLNGQEKDITLLYRNVYNGMDSFPLMAIPFFMLAGELMNKGGITMRLVEFSQALMGHLRGGLAHVNILSSMLFAGLSGSAVADTSALGSMLIPAMEKQGYTRRFAAAITAASSVIGPIIPPSGIMIIYAYVMGESVAALFLAGIVPGIMVGIGLMLMVKVMANKYDLPKAQRIVNPGQTMAPVEYWFSFIVLRANLAALFTVIADLVINLTGFASLSTTTSFILFAVFLAVSHVLLWKLRSAVSEDFRVVCKKAVAPLQTPIIILGGILLGVFTPTEAAAVAVAYALVIGFFVLHSIKVSEIPGVLNRAGITSAVVLLLVGAAMAFKTVVSLSHAPEIMAEFVLTLSENPLILLFLINLLLFVVGMFLDAGPAIIILGPILGPIFVNLGVDPIHFAIIMSVNLTIGLATPPMGLVLFVAASVSRERVETIAKAILPFLAVEIAVIFLITYIPALSMTIPRLTGFAN